jgi:FkbM family methyltransferase
MRQELAHLVQRALRRLSLDVQKFHPSMHPLARRMRLIDEHRIDVVLDVGANVGQWAADLRELGYRDWIVSFEPLSAAFAQLRKRAARDPRWKTVNLALGPNPGKATINIAGNSQSSSLLPMLDQHVKSAPQSAYVGREEITVQTLATALDEHRALGQRSYVKIDAQGYERLILDSGGDALSQVAGVQLEMSLTPLYQGEELLPQMVEHMSRLGFALMSLEPGYADPTTGRLLQVDGVFFRAASTL